MSIYYERLHAVAKSIQKDSKELAITMLADIPQIQDIDNDSLKTLIFLKSFQSKLGLRQSVGGNLYLNQFNIKQIDLFDSMAKLPLVNLVTETANSILMSCLQNQPEACIIEVGIGSGQQMVKLLRSLGESGAPPSFLKIVGIEPDEQSLKRSREAIEQVGAEIGIKIEFIEIHGCIEFLSDDIWLKLRNESRPKFLNASFSLHHISACLRQKVLEQLRGVDPSGFVLCEPDSNHETSDYLARFENAWNHFSLVFEAIDSLSEKRDLRTALKYHFFGREIEDILGSPENIRTERHEHSEMWVHRLKKAGFVLKLPKNFTPMVLGGSGNLKVALNRDWLSLYFQNDPIVSIFSSML